MSRSQLYPLVRRRSVAARPTSATGSAGDPFQSDSGGGGIGGIGGKQRRRRRKEVYLYNPRIVSRTDWCNNRPGVESSLIASSSSAVRAHCSSLRLVCREDFHAYIENSHVPFPPRPTPTRVESFVDKKASWDGGCHSHNCGAGAGVGDNVLRIWLEEACRDSSGSGRWMTALLMLQHSADWTLLITLNLFIWIYYCMTAAEWNYTNNEEGGEGGLVLPTPPSLPERLRRAAAAAVIIPPFFLAFCFYVPLAL